MTSTILPLRAAWVLLEREATRTRPVAAPDMRREGDVDVKHLVSELEAGAWLDRFKNAVEGRDAEVLADLFTPDCDLQGRQYGVPVHGRAALIRHWRDCLFEHQRDISFDCEIWATKGNVCFVHCRSTYTWLPINSFVEIDGVYRLSFDRDDTGALICRELREWIDYREVG